MIKVFIICLYDMYQGLCTVEGFIFMLCLYISVLLCHAPVDL